MNNNTMSNTISNTVNNPINGAEATPARTFNGMLSVEDQATGYRVIVAAMLADGWYVVGINGITKVTHNDVSIDFDSWLDAIVSCVCIKSSH